MLIFFRNIPSTTRNLDFYKFIRPVMGSGFFPAFKKGQIVNVKIVALLNNDTNIVEYHGLVRIEPDNVAKKVIKRLNCKPFKGVRINVREYRNRSWHNDPRIVLSNTKKSKNLRYRDRRRRNVEIVNDINELKFSSTSSFHRVL